MGAEGRQGKDNVTLKNGTQLKLDRCPHCGVAHPVLRQISIQSTQDYLGQARFVWGFYWCASCSGAVMTKANNSHEDNAVLDYWPKKPAVPAELPERAAAPIASAGNQRIAISKRDHVC